MPTLRLGDSERSNLTNAFKNVANRAKNGLVFPLTKEDFPEFGYSLLEPVVSNAYQVLTEQDPKLIKVSSWNPDFRVDTDTHQYTVGVYAVSMPRDGLKCPPSHPRYKEIADWAEAQYEIYARVNLAMSYLEEIITACTTLGQIKRILTGDIIQFVPSYMASTFEQAERQSRIPSSLGQVDGKMLHEIAEVLALGSLSPDRRAGLDAHCVSRAQIKLKE